MPRFWKCNQFGCSGRCKLKSHGRGSRVAERLMFCPLDWELTKKEGPQTVTWVEITEQEYEDNNSY